MGCRRTPLSIVASNISAAPAADVTVAADSVSAGEETKEESAEEERSESADEDASEALESFVGEESSTPLR